MGNYRRGSEAVIDLNDGRNFVRGEHFNGGALGGRGGRVSVFADENGAGDILFATIFAYCLGDGENVRFGKSSIEWCAAMTAGAETDELICVRSVRVQVVIATDEIVDIDQDFRRRWLSG